MVTKDTIKLLYMLMFIDFSTFLVAKEATQVHTSWATHKGQLANCLIGVKCRKTFAHRRSTVAVMKGGGVL